MTEKNSTGRLEVAEYRETGGLTIYASDIPALLRVPAPRGGPPHRGGLPAQRRRAVEQERRDEPHGRRGEGGPLGRAARRRWRDLREGRGIEWRAIRDVILPTLVDIADELDALRKERGQPKRGR